MRGAGAGAAGRRGAAGATRRWSPAPPQSPQKLLLGGRAWGGARGRDAEDFDCECDFDLPPPPPSPAKARRPRIHAGGDEGSRVPPDLAARRGCAVAVLSVASISSYLAHLKLDAAWTAVDEARERLAGVQVVGPERRGTKLSWCAPLEHACSYVTPGADPILHGRIVTGLLMPRGADVGSAADHAADAVSAVRGAGLNVTHAYVGKSSAYRWPKARTGDRSPPRSRARSADFALRDPGSWAADSFTGRLADHLDHGDLLVVVHAAARGLPNLGALACKDEGRGAGGRAEVRWLVGMRGGAPLILVFEDEAPLILLVEDEGTSTLAPPPTHQLARPHPPHPCRPGRPGTRTIGPGSTRRWRWSGRWRGGSARRQACTSATRGRCTSSTATP